MLVHFERSALIAMVLLLGAASGGPAGEGLAASASAQPASNAVLYIGSGSATPGGSARTDILLVLGPNAALNAFEIILNFNDAVITPSSVVVDAAWTSLDRGSSNARGTVTLAAFQLSPTCQPNGACHLAAIDWSGVTVGASAINAARVTLQRNGSELSDVKVVAGQIEVRASTAPGAVGTATGLDAVAGARGSGLAGDSADESTSPGADGLDTGTSTLVVTFMGVVAMLLAGAVFVVAVARKSWRWSANQAPVPAAPPDSNDPAVAAAVAAYLGKVEAFGRVSDDPGDDFVRDVALRMPAAPAQYPEGDNGRPQSNR